MPSIVKKGRNMLKRFLQISAVIVFLFTGLYIFPNFVSLDNERKVYIEQQIEDLIKFDIEIHGKITFRILPYPAIIMKNVDIKNFGKQNEPNTSTFLNAKQIFVSMDLLNLMSGDLHINKIIIDGGYLNYTHYKESGFENLDLILKGKSFNDLIIKNSTVISQNNEDGLNKVRRIYNINIHFKNILNSELQGTGSFEYLSNKVDDIVFYLRYVNNENYNLDANFDYINGKNIIKNRFNIVVKENTPVVNGTVDLTTDNLYKFIPLIDGSVEVPNIPLFNDKLNIKTTIQTTSEAIILSNGTFTSNDAFANFSSIIPFTRSDDNKISLVKNNISFNVDFKNLKLSKILTMPDNIFRLSNTNKDEIKELLKVFAYPTLNIFVKNLLLENDLITNFELNSAPIYQNNNYMGIDIKKLNYSLGKNPIQITGKLFDIFSDIKTDLVIKNKIPVYFPNIFFKMTRINSFDARVIKENNTISVSDLNLNIDGNKLFGSVDTTLSPNGNDYNIVLKSDELDTTKFTKSKIDLAYIIHNLSLIKKSSFKLNAMIKSLKTPSNKYDLLKLDTSFKNDTLSVKKLTFKESDYSSTISGDLVGITQDNGSFKNFNYVINSDNLRGLTLPFIRNSFIDKIIANGVKTINIKLNGSASNPVSDVYAVLNNISVRVNGRLLEGSEKYSLDLSHTELKGFLFSWGFIDDTLMNYFYDDIPFSLKAEVDGNNIKDIKLKIKNNLFTGDILRKNISRSQKNPTYETNVDLSIDNFDVKAIIKRLKDTDAYVDFLLKIIRTVPYNIKLNAKNIVEYNGNVYKDLYLNLVNSKNPGSLEFNIQKVGRLLKLSSEILNNRIFTGKLSVENFVIPNDLMNNELMNLTSGLMNLNLDFRTDGMNIYQLTSNLSGSFKANIKNGTIKGISDYDTILRNVVELSNITTNNILYALENSFKSGMLNFTNLVIEGKIDMAEIVKSAFTLSSKNMLVTGFVSGNLIKKSLNIESLFEIKNLSTETLNLIYNIKGFINNLGGEVDTSAIMSKINTSYLQKKKKEIFN